MALADFNSAIALNPSDYPGFYDFKGKVLKKKERYKEAISSFTKSLELYPDDCEILQERMECYEVLLDEESAEADRQQMFSLGCEEVN
jgi:tetratricopeptide (TPR) repeat protein